MVNVYFKVIDSTTNAILKELRDLRNNNVRIWVKREDNENNKAILHIRDKKIIEHDLTNKELNCYCWNINKEQVDRVYEGLEHLISRYIADKTTFVCIDNVEHDNNLLILFQDAKHKNDYPKEFIKIPCYKEWLAFSEYLKEQQIFTFSLKDKTRFDKCPDIQVKGSTVYKEKGTGYLWYFDNFHGTHYEVFDKTGNKHLGEADLNGKLDRSKADKDKKLYI